MEIHINLNNLVKNILEIKKNLNEDTKFLFMVKSNAYNHGSIEVAKATQCFVDYFGVATIEEGVRLRKNGIKIPILVFMVTDDNLTKIIDFNLTPVSSNLHHLEILNTYASINNKICNVHLPIDTGMNRIGLKTKKEVKDFLTNFKELEHLKLVGICSHFYSNDKNIVKKQYKKFLEIAELAENKNLIKHIASSESFKNYPTCQLDMVRIGMCAYGYSSALNVTPVMEVISNIIAIKNVSKNEVIGYNGKFIAFKKMKIAIIAGGYADGISRFFTDKYVLINGKKCEIVGNICMDMFMADITNLNCKIGDRVTILGKNKFCQISASSLAENFTITYEILTNFKGRFHKKYFY